MFGRFFKCLFNKPDNLDEKVEHIKGIARDEISKKNAEIDRLKIERDKYAERSYMKDIEIERIQSVATDAGFDEEAVFNAGLLAGARDYIATGVKVSDNKKGRKKKQSEEDAKELLKAQIKKKAKAKAKKPKIDNNSIL
jgi:hypothetical protein